MPTTIRQSVMFKATPHQVYEALMDAKQHTEFTGDAAKITRKVGGTFSAYGGYITGKHIELVQDEKIVQEWIASDFPQGHTSTVTFILKPTKSGSKLIFTHAHVPPAQYESLKQGWIDYYWEPMKEFFKEEKL